MFFELFLFLDISSFDMYTVGAKMFRNMSQEIIASKYFTYLFLTVRFRSEYTSSKH